MPEFDPNRQSQPIMLMWIIGGLLLGIAGAVWLLIVDGFSPGVVGVPILGLVLGCVAAYYDGRL